MKVKTKIKYIIIIVSGGLLLSVTVWRLNRSSLIQEPRFPSVPSKHDSGVIYYNKSKASSAEYFAVSDFGNCAVYSVSGKFVQTFPGGLCQFDRAGYYISAIDSSNLYFFNKEMDVIWKLKFNRIHHDIHVNEARKEIALATSEDRQTSEWGLIADHGVSIVDYSGKKVFQWSVLESLKALKAIQKKYGREIKKDKKNRLLKINSVQIIPENEAYKKNIIFKPGNLLINFDIVSMTIILRRKDKKIIWFHIHPGNSTHSPRILRSGTMLYINNQFQDPTEEDKLLLLKNKSVFTLDKENFYFMYALGTKGKLILFDLRNSSVDIMDPLTKVLLWRYSTPLTLIRFASPWLGFTQLLENGNIVVTHMTHGGSAFEVTPKGEIVWEWVNDNKHPTGRPINIRAVQKIHKEVIQPFLNQTF